MMNVDTFSFIVSLGLGAAGVAFALVGFLYYYLYKRQKAAGTSLEVFGAVLILIGVLWGALDAAS